MQRGIVTVVAVGALTAVLLWPVAVWVRVLLVGAGLGVGLDQAFRRIPAFDLLGRVRWRLPRQGAGRKVCALTFDDGPSPATAATLDILAAEGVRATFFVVGTNVERHPDTVRRMQAEGHAVGLHGLTHARLSGAPLAEVERQMSGAISTLRRLGITPAPLYRTPHGAKSAAVCAAARRLDLTLWAWSRGIWDTDRPSPSTLVRRATRFARSGMVLLLHDGHDEDPMPDVRPMLEALPAIIGDLKRRGFSFVTLIGT